MKSTLASTFLILFLSGYAVADRLTPKNGDRITGTIVTRRIGWQLTLSDRYLSDPPGGFRQNDLILTTGIKVKLGVLK
jgi:hypothetical protein